MIEREQHKLSTSRQCELLGVGRSTYYYRPKGTLALDLKLIYGSRKMAELLARVLSWPVNRKRVQRLMRLMGIEAIYQKPHTSQPAAGHKVYPYLLKGLRSEERRVGKECRSRWSPYH